MNKKRVLVVLMSFLMTGFTSALAEEEAIRRDSRMPPGMAVKKIDRINVVVPKDAKIYKKGMTASVEGGDEYAARKFIDVDDRFAKNESTMETLKKELLELKKEIRALNEELYRQRESDRIIEKAAD